MLSILSTLFFFTLTLGILIAFHEFGHFYVARKLGVHVIRFSIGFGKPIFKVKDKKNTEFVLSWIPLGGYVKMLGESQEESIPKALKAQAFSQKSVWARMLIIIAGPLFNLILAVIALWLMFMIGVTSLTPIIGKIEPNSIAEKIHLEPMDEIVSIDHVVTNSWRDVQMALVPAIGESQPLSLQLVNIKTHAHHSIQLSLHNWTLEEKDNNLIEKLGVTPAVPSIPPIIQTVYRNYPGADAGLKNGDKIIRINGKKVNDWMQVVSIIQNNAEKKVTLTVKRPCKKTSICPNKTLFIYPQAKKIQGKIFGYIGVEANPPENMKAIWLRTERYSLLEALGSAMTQTQHLTQVSFKLIGKLLTGTFSFHTISGPIGMAQWAGQAAQLGLAHYLSFIALISVSLGVLNILPIPILDGGHLLYCVFEVILRRPLSEKIRLFGVRLGFSLLVTLMFLAVFNDISRLSS
jgi:regulator of sigma E protease